MRILFIDSESFEQHLNYNVMQIEALNKLTTDISFIFKKGYAKKLGIHHNYINIPKCLYCNLSNSFFNRLLMLCRYWYIIFRMINKFHKYDSIVISYYDQIPFYFAQLFPKNTYLINHINIAEIYRSKFKRFLFKKISKRYNQIVMDKMSMEYLKSLGINNVHIVNHGIVKPYELNYSCEEHNIIFCPSATSVDGQLMESIISDSEFIDLLKLNDYKLIIKGNYVASLNETVVIIDRFLDENEYKNLILCSKIIFLPYSKNFVFRASGVLFEGIANNKIIVARSIPSLMQYNKIYNNLYGFVDEYDLKIIMKQVIHNNVKQKYDRCKLMPDYSFLKEINYKRPSSN